LPSAGFFSPTISLDPSLEDSVFLSDYPKYPAAWADEALLARWEKIMAVRETVTKAIEERRQAGEVGSSLEARITLRTSREETRKFLGSALALWPQVAIVSEASVEFDPAAPELEVKVAKAEGAKCPRCWQWKRDIGSDPRHAGVCGRCASALEASAAK
jgi:isoleucyl-tRNA synthetase